MANSDSEYEIEEAVVLVELNGIIDANFLLQDQSPCKVLGIDTENPIMQIGHYIFSGEYEDTAGTIVCYEPISSAGNEATESSASFKVSCQTNKKLTMKRVFIKDKSKDNMEICQTSPCTVEVTKTNTEHLLEISNKINGHLMENFPPETTLRLPNKEKKIRNLSTNPTENNKEIDSPGLSLSHLPMESSNVEEAESTLLKDDEYFPSGTKRKRVQNSDLKDSHKKSTPKLTKNKRQIGRKNRKRKHKSPNRDASVDTDSLKNADTINKQMKTDLRNSSLKSIDKIIASSVETSAASKQLNAENVDEFVKQRKETIKEAANIDNNTVDANDIGIDNNIQTIHSFENDSVVLNSDTMELSLVEHSDLNSVLAEELIVDSSIPAEYTIDNSEIFAEHIIDNSEIPAEHPIDYSKIPSEYSIENSGKAAEYPIDYSTVPTKLSIDNSMISSKQTLDSEMSAGYSIDNSKIPSELSTDDSEIPSEYLINNSEIPSEEPFNSEICAEYPIDNSTITTKHSFENSTNLETHTDYPIDNSKMHADHLTNKEMPAEYPIDNSEMPAEYPIDNSEIFAEYTNENSSISAKHSIGNSTIPAEQTVNNFEMPADYTINNSEIPAKRTNDNLQMPSENSINNSEIPAEYPMNSELGAEHPIDKSTISEKNSFENSTIPIKQAFNNLEMHADYPIDNSKMSAEHPTNKEMPAEHPTTEKMSAEYPIDNSEILVKYPTNSEKCTEYLIENSSISAEQSIGSSTMPAEQTVDNLEMPTDYTVDNSKISAKYPNDNLEMSAENSINNSEIPAEYPMTSEMGAKHSIDNFTTHSIDNSTIPSIQTLDNSKKAADYSLDTSNLTTDPIDNSKMPVIYPIDSSEIPAEYPINNSEMLAKYPINFEMDAEYHIDNSTLAANHSIDNSTIPVEQTLSNSEMPADYRIDNVKKPAGYLIDNSEMNIEYSTDNSEAPADYPKCISEAHADYPIGISETPADYPSISETPAEYPINSSKMPEEYPIDYSEMASEYSVENSEIPADYLINSEVGEAHFNDSSTISSKHSIDNSTIYAEQTLNNPKMSADYPIDNSKIPTEHPNDNLEMPAEYPINSEISAENSIETTIPAKHIGNLTMPLGQTVDNSQMPVDYTVGNSKVPTECPIDNLEMPSEYLIDNTEIPVEYSINNPKIPAEYLLDNSEIPANYPVTSEMGAEYPIDNSTEHTIDNSTIPVKQTLDKTEMLVDYPINNSKIPAEYPINNSEMPAEYSTDNSEAPANYSIYSETPAENPIESSEMPAEHTIDNSTILAKQILENSAISVEQSSDHSLISSKLEIISSYVETSAASESLNAESSLPSINIDEDLDDEHSQNSTTNIDIACVNNNPAIEANTLDSNENEASLVLKSGIVDQLVESSTDKKLVLVSSPRIDEIQVNDNCSSSGDMVNHNDISTYSSDVCQTSSDCKSTLAITDESMDNNNASSSYNLSENRQDKSEDEEGQYFPSDNTGEKMPTACEVSQSLKDDTILFKNDLDIKDSSECEVYNSPNTVRDNNEAIENDFNASEMDESDQSSLSEGIVFHNRKLSSCEVTQSNNSERESFESRDTTDECEVFVQTDVTCDKNAMGNEVVPTVSIDNTSDQVEYSRTSLASEGSTSEISQSHKSVIQDSKSDHERNSEDLLDTGGDVCSQSSDQSKQPSMEVSTELKDLCVSSCDVTKDASTNDDESGVSEEDISNTSCEISQSDKVEGINVPSIDLETSENNIQMFDNECDEASCFIAEIVVNPSESERLEAPTKDDDNMQGPCEVTQSFCSELAASSHDSNILTDDQAGSSECDICEDNSSFIEVLDEDSEEVLEVGKDVQCKVSQSFESKGYIAPSEAADPCGSSDTRSEGDENLKGKSDIYKRSVDNKADSNECDTNEEDTTLHDILNEESPNNIQLSDVPSAIVSDIDTEDEQNCVISQSSKKVKNVSDVELGNQEIDPNCEVSQSFKLIETGTFLDESEPCGSSNVRFDDDVGISERNGTELDLAHMENEVDIIECDTYDESSASVEILDGDSKCDSPSSEEIEFSSSIPMDSEAESGVQQHECEKTQSLKSKENSGSSKENELCESSSTNSKVVFGGEKRNLNECKSYKDSSPSVVVLDDLRDNSSSDVHQIPSVVSEVGREENNPTVSQSFTSKKINDSTSMKSESDQDVDPLCEVSQSFKPEECNVSVEEPDPCGSSNVGSESDAKNSKKENNNFMVTHMDEKVGSNECDVYDESSVSVEILNDESRDNILPGGTPMELEEGEQQKQAICEVSQSSSSKEKRVTFEESEFCGTSTKRSDRPKNLADNVTDSTMALEDNMCLYEYDPYEDSSSSIEIVDDESKDNCASSDDVSQHSTQTESEIEVEEQEKVTVCEVSQSFRSRNMVPPGEPEPSGSSDYNTEYLDTLEVSETDSQIMSLEEKVDSNECEIYDDNSHSVEVLDDESKDNCDNPNQPITSELRYRNASKLPSCEVSQSFVTKNINISFEDAEPCGSSDRMENRENFDDSSINSCNVTQSLKHERTDFNNKDENECDHTDLNSNPDEYHLEFIDDPPKNVCESSDDVIVIVSEESLEEQSINCEVSQSYSQEKVPNLIADQTSNVVIESSNECEMYSPSELAGLEPSVQTDTEEKSICESSDDIKYPLESQHSSNQMGDGTCQSSEYDENDFVRNVDDPNIPESYENNDETTDNIKRDISDVCESTEGIMISETANLETGFDACTSSDKVFKKPNSRVENLHDDYNLTNASFEETENQISQSGNKTISPSYQLNSNLSANSSLQNDPVIVSSSVDSISSSCVDVIYSTSNVSNSNFPSNFEVSQSSASCVPYVWDGNSFVSGHLPEKVNTNTGISNNSPSAILASENGNLQPLNINAAPNLNVDNVTYESNVENATDRFEESSISSSVSQVSKIELDVPGTSKTQSYDKTNITEAPSFELDSTNQASGVFKRESVISSASKYSFSGQQTSSSKLGFIDNSEINPMPPHLQIIPESDSSPDVRPSLLEVIVSSASDFRNSLLYDSASFVREGSQTIPVAESSSNNVVLTGELLERTGSEVEESRERYYSNLGDAVANTMYMTEAHAGFSQHHVSQSSDITHSHSSTSNIPTILIGESKPDIVQSSSAHSGSTISRPMSHLHTSFSSMEEGVAIFVSQDSENQEVPESSTSQIQLQTSGDSRVPSESTTQSSDITLINKDDLSFQTGSTDSEVSSTPFHLQHSNLEVLEMEDGEHCSIIEGDFIIVSESGEILHRSSEDDIQQASLTSGNNQFVLLNSNLADGQTLILEASNEAETLNSVAFPSQSEVPMSTPETASEMSVCELVIEERTSASPVNEIEITAEEYDCNDSSGVSESLEVQQTVSNEPILEDNSISCSVAVDDPTSIRNYSFPQTFSVIAQETGSARFSAYESDCQSDNLLPVRNEPLTTGTELSMYSHIGEFEDSVQSSSLDATHISINEQIKAISSPSFSNSDTNDEQTPLRIPPFSFSSDSHNLASIQCAIPSISNIKSPLLTEELQAEDSNSDLNEIYVGNYSIGTSSNLKLETSGESSQISDTNVTEDIVSPQEYTVLPQSEADIMCAMSDDSVIVSSHDQSQDCLEKDIPEEN